MKQKTTEETGRLLHSTDPGGLSAEEARKRLEQYGPNRLQGAGAARLFFPCLLSQFMDPLIYVLAAAGVISVFLGEIGDACIIAAVAALNGAVGMIQEGKAKRAPGCLEKNDPSESSGAPGSDRPGDRRGRAGAWGSSGAGRRGGRCRRILGFMDGKSAGRGIGPDGERRRGPQATPVFLRPPAFRWETGKHGLYVLQCDGWKGAGHGDGDRHGHGDRQDRPSDPGGPHGGHTLTETAGDLGGALSILAVALCAALFGLAVWQKRDVGEMLITAISLAVAAVPEGLPAVVTIVLALSVSRMARVHTTAAAAVGGDSGGGERGLLR